MSTSHEMLEKKNVGFEGEAIAESVLLVFSNNHVSVPTNYISCDPVVVVVVGRVLR